MILTKTKLFATDFGLGLRAFQFLGLQDPKIALFYECVYDTNLDKAVGPVV